MNTKSEPQSLPLAPHGVLETALYVDDLNVAEEFYSSVLGLRMHSSHNDRHLFFYCGSGMLLLFHAATTATPGPVIGGGFLPAHGATGAGHVAFRVHTSEIDNWKARLAAAEVALESEIIWPEGGHSLYFRDPAGNSLELATPQLWGFSEIEARLDGAIGS